MKSFEDFAKDHAPELKDKELIRLAEERGYVIHKPRPPEKVHDLDLSRLRGERVKIGVVSDTHFGSLYQQPSYLKEHYALFKKERVSAIFHCGDLTDGPPEMHKGHGGTLFLHTYEAQRGYAIETLPTSNIPQYIISGNHDDSWLKNNAGPIVKDVAGERDDLTFVGQSDGYVQVGDVLVHLTHPHMGGAYALSYRLQKVVEAYSPERRPHILLMGNFHKVCSIDSRNVAAFMLPSYQAQTAWMASKGLPSIVGGLILEFGVTTKGLAPDITVRWLVEREPRANDWG
jgi:predicted phosphodiesterase